MTDVRTALSISADTGQSRHVAEHAYSRAEPSGTFEHPGEPSGTNGAPATPVQLFLRGLLPDSQGDAVHQRLRAAHVLVTGHGPIPGIITALLKQSAVGSVERMPVLASGMAAHSGEVRPHDLTIEVRSTAEDRANAPVIASALAHLPVRVGAQEISIGPLLGVPGARCALCCASAQDQVDNDAGTADHDGSAASVAASLAAGAALRYLGGYGTTYVWKGTICICLDDPRQRYRPAFRRADCPACGQPGIRLHERDLPEFNQDQMAETPPRGGDVRGPCASNRHTSTAPRRYLTEHRLKQPVDHASSSAAGDPGEYPLAEEQPGHRWQSLSWLLEHALGAPCEARAPDGRPGPRWVPSVGGLWSCYAYVIPRRCGAATQAWYYDAAAREYAALSGPVPAGLAGCASRATTGFSLILVSDLATSTSQYGALGTRVAHLDAGAALAQLGWCCRALGWRMAIRRPDLPGTVLTALDLDPDRETITALVDLTFPAHPAGERGTEHQGRGRRAAEASALLRRSVMSYDFGAAMIPNGIVGDAARRAVSRAQALWHQPGRTRRTGLDGGCLVYARRVTGLPTGLYDPLSGASPLHVTPLADEAVIEAYLSSRGIDPAALLLCHGERERVISAQGTDGHRKLIISCSITANFIRLLSTASGLSTGLLARLPSALLDAAAGRLRVGPQVYCGVAIGIGRPSTTNNLNVIW